MATDVATLRLPQGMVKRLKILARRLSLAHDRDITWAEIVRQSLEQLLAAQVLYVTEEA
jgi:hypothetical protein